MSITEQLIEARCNIDVQMKDAAAPLHDRIYGHEAVTKQLIEARCNVDLPTEKKDGA